MGYLDEGEDPETIPVFMYDGAGAKADVGSEVSFVTPASRFVDGDQLKVTDSHQSLNEPSQHTHNS